MNAGQAEASQLLHGGAAGCSGRKWEIIMMIVLKIAAAALIGFGLLQPSFSPKAEDASCSCKADA